MQELDDKVERVEKRAARRVAARKFAARKRSELKLQNERGFSSAVLETVAALVLVLDRQGRILEFNRACQLVTGFGVEEVRGKCLWDLPLLVPEENASSRAVFDELLEGRAPVSVENHWVAKAGRRYRIAWSNTPLSAADGSVEYVVGTGIDVTEQRRAEEALRQTEQRFHSAAESFPGAFTIYDHEKRFLFMNALGAKLCGCTQEECLGRTNEELFPPEMTRTYTATLDRCLETKTEQTVEASIPFPEGTRTLLINLVPLLDQDGNLFQILGTAYDITERKRAAEARAESEARLRAIVETAPDAIISADAEGVLMSWNRAASAIFGYAEEEVLGKSITILTPERYREDCIRRLKRINASDPSRLVGSSVRHWRGLKKDGTEFPIELSSSEWALGGRTFFSTIIRDLTQRERAQEQLRQSEERFSAFMRHLPGLAVMKDREGRYLFLSEQLAAVLHRDVRELLGKTLDELESAVCVERVRAIEREVIETGASVQSVENFELSGSCLKWLVHRFPIVDKRGATALVGSIAIDVTDRIRAEEELKQALEKEVVLRREIHHRVKNNLQVITSLLYLQSTQVNDPKTLEILRESQVRIRSIGITHELLSQSADLTRIDFAGYVRQITAHLLTAYEVRSRIKLVIEADRIPLGLDTALSCGLIITELVSNAIKYAFGPEREGTIGIELKSERENLRLTVRDDGCGFPPGLDLFNANSMGLSLVRDLARQLDGVVSFECDSGTVISVRFVRRVTL